jgi:hypothetical protein
VRQRLIAALVLAAAAGAARAETKVLDGVPAFYDMTVVWPADPPPSASGPDAFSTATLAPDAPRPPLGGVRLSGVPEYVWWYGCSPTAGGMMVGYWDGIQGRENLFDGDARQWFGNQDTGTKAMVASRAHITAGRENGKTYGDWHNSTSYPNHQANPDCIADFMKTEDSGSYAANITSGLKRFIEWDNPGTALHEGQPATTADTDVPFYGGNFSYESFKAEINTGRPVLLDLMTAETASKWIGHSVVGYGYRDEMFKVKVAKGVGAEVDMVVGGFAVMDTWANGTAQSEWVDWDWNVIPSVLEGNVEWWPFVPLLGASWIYDDGTPGPYDWLITDAVTLYVTPEPATLALVAVGAMACLRRHRKHASAAADG